MCKYVIVLLRGSFHKCYSIVNLIFQFAQLFFLLDSVIKIILQFFTFILIHLVLLILYVLPGALMFSLVP